MMYLNYAALFPTRPEAAQAVQDTLKEFNTYLYSDAGIQWYLRKVHHCRNQVATFLNVSDPSTIAFVSNASTAHHLTLSSLSWTPEDAVLTTTHENPSITRQLHALEQRGVQIHAIPPSSPDYLVQSISDALDKRKVKAIIVSHVSHVDGRIFPIHEISRIARTHDITLIVDGAQAVGHIPVDLNQLDYDVYFFTGHKWCEGPLGTGAMIVNPNFLKGDSTLPIQMTKGKPAQTTQFEIGTQNIGLIAGLAQACEIKSQEGMGTERLHSFRQQAKDFLGNHSGLTIVEWDGPQAPGIMTIQGKPGFDHRKFTEQLAEESHIIVKPFVEYPPDIIPAIRLSWSATMDEQVFHEGIKTIGESLRG